MYTTDKSSSDDQTWYAPSQHPSLYVPLALWTQHLIENSAYVFDQRIRCGTGADQLRMESAPIRVISALVVFASDAVVAWAAYAEGISRMRSGAPLPLAAGKLPIVDLPGLMEDWTNDQEECLHDWFTPLVRAMVDCKARIPGCAWNPFSIGRQLNVSDDCQPWHICFDLMTEARDCLMRKWSSPSSERLLANFGQSCA
jgi:hypothetical protein